MGDRSVPEPPWTLDREYNGSPVILMVMVLGDGEVLRPQKQHEFYSTILWIYDIQIYTYRLKASSIFLALSGSLPFSRSPNLTLSIFLLLFPLFPLPSSLPMPTFRIIAIHIGQEMSKIGKWCFGVSSLGCRLFCYTATACTCTLNVAIYEQPTNFRTQKVCTAQITPPKRKFIDFRRTNTQCTLSKCFCSSFTISFYSLW